MAVAEDKRSWFLARRAELHARGLKDVDIARQMGLQRAYFSQVVGGANVGDGFIDRYRKGARLLGLPTDPKGIAGANALANKWLKVAARAVGITARLHTHNARHTTALWLFRAGVDDRVIQDVLGVDPKAFAHYKARITQDDRDDALRKALGGLE